MSRTGNSWDRRLTRRGFTLVEVMVTAAVLAFGIVLLYQSFFISLDAVQHASNRLHAMAWLEGAIEHENEALMDPIKVTLGQESGEFTLESRLFKWQKSSGASGVGLCPVSVTLSWKEAGRPRSLSYATVLCPQKIITYAIVSTPAPTGGEDCS